MPTSTTCTFTSPRGHELHARLDQPDDGRLRGAALFAHCFTCSKDLKVEKQITQALTGHGFAVLSFDFTGLGRSGGEFAETTFSADVEDLVAAAAYLEREVAPTTLLVGHSLGGAAVLTAAPRIDSVSAVATIGAPSDPTHVEHLLSGGLDEILAEGEGEVTIAGRNFTIGKSFVHDLATHRLTEQLPELGRALLVMHSPLDQTVGVDNAREIYDAAKHPKSFVSLDRADHLLSDPMDARYAAQVIAAWAERYLPESAIRDGEEEKRDYSADGAISTTGTELATDVESRGFTLRVDEPASVGGTETGPTPYDYLATALASCTTLTIRIYADRKGYQLESVTASVDYDRVHAKDCERCEHQSGRIERFTKVITLEGALSDDERADLLRVADKCPVHKTLHGQIEVFSSLA
ncbi:bifunctional alpha/beta hydrolase/OsmC family protein [Euzebya tangerina]|uniref:bifunctional alpha/beta hydrolase/OsmC family protein n=1 Tax=Euzebya tangerina TaxID=591198 RepID=UPI000E31073B|nr:bifunctional alpha/beta hydrolase/OsmC family protein [Euzebya tangerina]